MGQEDPLKKEMATHSSILAWRIHGQRSLAAYSPQSPKELDTSKRLVLSLFTLVTELQQQQQIYLGHDLTWLLKCSGNSGNSHAIDKNQETHHKDDRHPSTEEKAGFSGRSGEKTLQEKGPIYELKAVMRKVQCWSALADKQQNLDCSGLGAPSRGQGGPAPGESTLIHAWHSLLSSSHIHSALLSISARPGVLEELSASQIVLNSLTSSVQFSHSVVFNSLPPHELRHARPPCPSPTPRVHSDSSPLSQ